MNKKPYKVVTQNGKIYAYPYGKKITLPDGRRIERRGQTKREVEEKIRQARVEYENEAVKNSRFLTVADVADSYLEEFKPTDAPQTRQGRIHHLERYILPQFGKMKASKLTTKEIRKFYDSLLIEKGLNKVVQVNKILRHMVGWAINNGLGFVKNPINQDVMAKIRRTNQRQQRFNELEPETPKFSRADIERIIDQSKGSRCDVLVQLQLLHGLRIGEALALKWEDVDFNSKTIHVRSQVSATSKRIRKGTDFESDTYLIETPTKTKGSNRVLPLHPTTRELLMQNSEEGMTGIITKTRNGTYLSYSNYRNRDFKPLMQRLGFNYTTHALRGMYGAVCVADGEYIVNVAQRMGHSDATTLIKHYLKGLI